MAAMNPGVRPASFKDTLLTAAAPAIWGSTYLVAAELLPQDRPLTAAAIRTVPAGLALVVAMRFGFFRTSPGRLLVLAIINISAFQALLFVAAERLPGGLAAVVGALQPLFLLLISWIVDHVRPTSLALVSAVLSVAGMALVFASPDAARDPLGIVAAFLATLCMAVGSFLSRRWQGTTPLLAFAGWQILLGGLVLVPFAIALEAPLPPLSQKHVTGYLYLILVGTLIAYPLWIRGVSRLPPGAVGALSLINPMTALLLGWIVVGSGPTSTEIAGVIIVLLSISVLQQTGTRAGTPRPTPHAHCDRLPPYHPNFLKP